jgi:hypothetical protein
MADFAESIDNTILQGRLIDTLNKLKPFKKKYVIFNVKEQIADYNRVDNLVRSY